MTPERWAQIEEVFHRAAECAPEGRTGLLDETCGNDAELRREVEALLSCDGKAGDSVQAVVRSELSAVAFPLTGETISHYRILDGLGGGGMGLVYRAEDIRLGRRVALKFLPEESAKDPAALGRFEREARSASSLEHPNICPIYEFGEHEGRPFLAMQLLEGQTLRELISAAGATNPPLEIEKLLDLAIQITEGLNAAHQKGIIHRDIKPANVFITNRGEAKILDFGLAKVNAGSGLVAAREEHPVAAPLRDTTAVVRAFDPSLTKTGAAMGTAAHMSPEQVRGEKLDARTDLFSFGAVLHEMATGQQAFSGPAAAILHDAILGRAPVPARQLNPEVPAKLEAIINKALQKERELRYQSASEMRTDLKGLQQEAAIATVGVDAKRDRRKEDDAHTVRVKGNRGRQWLLWALAAILVSGLLTLAITTLVRGPKAGPAMHSAFILPPGFRLDAENTSLALSPGGQKLAFAAAGPDGKQQLWLRSMGDLAMKPLGGTEGATYPFWSPDGRYLGFFADHKLKKVEILSGAVQALCDATLGRGGSWNRDGMIAFAPAAQGALYEVSASGGNPIQLTSAKNGITNRLPHFLPDGKRLLFFSGDTGLKDNGIYSLDLETRKVELVANEDSEGLYVEPGYLVFVRGRNLMAQRLDSRRLRTSGQAAPIAEHVLFNAIRWTGAYSFSDSGLLVFQSGSGAVKSRLTWFDTDGKNLGTLGQPGGFTFVTLSPDGKRALTEVMGDDGRVNLWMYDLGRGIGTPFSSGPGSYRDPVWSPDARSVIYDDRSNMTPDYKGPDGTTEYEFHRKASDDTADARIPSAGGVATSWSPDGKSLAFVTGNLGAAIWILPMVGPGKPYPFVVTPAGKISNYWRRGSFSPDGRWFSYLSDETGRPELFVAPFPGPGGKWQISSDGADAPQWVGGGGELAYINADRKLVAVGIRAKGQKLETGKAQVLFGGQPLPALPCDPSTYGAPVYFSADGKRILLPVPLLEDSTPSLTLVTNWTTELKD